MRTIGKRLGWYAHRLAAMSGAEVGHRLSEQAKRWASRFHQPDFTTGIRSDQLPILPGMAQGLEGLKDEDALLDRWREIALRARAGRPRLIGLEWPEIRNGQGLWHLDPVTGGRWPPHRYCFAIPYRHAPDMGDVKYVWELNRLQFLQPIAALAALEDDRGLARFCLATVDDWIMANPPFKGVNWASGIELACRIVSLLTIFTLLPTEVLSREQRRRFLATLATHGYWLMRYPSRYSSANNHLIAEAGGLYLLGTLAPELPHAQAWRRYGRDTLIEEAQKQIHPDGVGAEQSPTYTAFTLEWLLLCGIVARHLGEPFPEGYWARIEKAGVFLRWITDARGNQPSIGDDDEGRVFYSQTSPEPYVSSVLGCIAKTRNRTDLSPPCTQPHLREAMFGRISSNHQGFQGFRCFAKGGYTVARSDAHGNQDLFVMDHGPLGYLSIAAHGHTDALSIWLHIDGQPIIVDAGTYLYHSGGSWRNHFRSTLAHNTLAINNEDSSQIAGSFNWSTRANCTLIDHRHDAKGWSIEAEHDGYVKQFGVKHRRRVSCTNNRTYTVTDTLIGTRNTRYVEIGFLLHPEVSAEKRDDCWEISKNNRPLLTIRQGHDSRLASRLQSGQTNPPRGWYSNRFGHKVQTKRLVFYGPLETLLPHNIVLSLA